MSDTTLQSDMVQRTDRTIEAMTRTTRGLLPPAIFLVVLVLLWAIGSAYGVVPNYLLPSPAAIFNEFVSNSRVLIKHASATTLEALTGFAIGSIAGVVVATALTFSSVLREALYPYALVSRAIPFIVFTPLVVVLLGRGFPPIVAIVSFSVYFPTFLNMMRGLSAADADYHEMLHTMSATPLQRLRLVDFPVSMPYLFAALKVSASGAFISALVTEWIGADTGLGYLVVVSGQYFKLPTMWAAIFTSALLTLALLGAVTLAEKLLGRFTSTAREIGA
ncbi:MAG: ABC transporter permease [Alphaproteobacteria bacterium]|nr:MAG: ABC transporter permease [Alphaproteobacteria bacterium]